MTSLPVDDAETVLSAGLDGPLEGLATRTNGVDVLSVKQSVERATRSIVGDEVGRGTHSIGKAGCVSLGTTDSNQ